MSNSWTQKVCRACEGGVLPLSRDQAGRYLQDLPGWELDGQQDVLRRKFEFKNFVDAMAFVNQVADLAEKEGHHPDIALSYNHVTCTLTTHAINGLSENDFIMASKMNAMVEM